MNHNRMTALPVEIGQMRCLRELDISCNDIHQLPPQIGQISTLRRLDLRKNKLTQLPSGKKSYALIKKACKNSTLLIFGLLELKKLSLTYLDISENFIAFLPSSLAEMMSLKIVHLAGNPLQSPPASVSRPSSP
jgi:leucine-rich repeat protein SHOC2